MQFRRPVAKIGDVSIPVGEWQARVRMERTRLINQLAMYQQYSQYFGMDLSSQEQQIILTPHAAKAWQKKKAAAGWSCLVWPREYGGRGATPVERVIWEQEEGVYAKLALVFVIGSAWPGRR